MCAQRRTPPGVYLLQGVGTTCMGFTRVPVCYMGTSSCPSAMARCWVFVCHGETLRSGSQVRTQGSCSWQVCLSDAGTFHTEWGQLKFCLLLTVATKSPCVHRSQNQAENQVHRMSLALGCAGETEMQTPGPSAREDRAQARSPPW